MKKFNEFMAQQGFGSSNEQQPALSQNPQHATQPSMPVQQAQPNIEDESIKKIIRTRLQQVFQELSRSNIPASKQVHLLTIIVKEFQTELGMSNSQARTAFNMARGPVNAS